MIGQEKNPKCKQNMIKPIDRKICRNNCRYWKNKKCLLKLQDNSRTARAKTREDIQQEQQEKRSPWIDMS